MTPSCPLSVVNPWSTSPDVTIQTDDLILAGEFPIGSDFLSEYSELIPGHA